MCPSTVHWRRRCDAHSSTAVVQTPPHCAPPPCRLPHSPQDVYTAFADKRSVVLHAIERTRTPIRELVCAGVVASAGKYKPLLHVGTQMHGLERALVLRSTTNAYFSPPYARGLETHWDLTDVFVLQVQGQGVCGGAAQ